MQGGVDRGTIDRANFAGSVEVVMRCRSRAQQQRLEIRVISARSGESHCISISSFANSEEEVEDLQEPQAETKERERERERGRKREREREKGEKRQKRKEELLICWWQGRRRRKAANCWAKEK